MGNVFCGYGQQNLESLRKDFWANWAQKKPPGFLHPDGSFFVTAFRLSRGYSAIRTFVINILLILFPCLFTLTGYLAQRRAGRLFIMNCILSLYLTTTFVASPSTATTTIPAGTAIVTLSEAATWLASV